MTKDLLRDIAAKFPQYVPVLEHIDWESSYMKDGYGYKDLKLYWWTSLRDMHTVEAMIYAEGLILLYSGHFSYDWLRIATFKIMIDKASDTIIDNIEIAMLEETILTTYNHIMDNREAILKADKDWRPDTVFTVKKQTHKKKLTREDFIDLIDECESLTGRRTRACCVEYFKANTGLSASTFRDYLKKFNIVLEREKPRDFDRTKCGKKKPEWLAYINNEDWRLKPEQIGKLAIQRCPWIDEIKVQVIKNWKYKKMKELGLSARQYKKQSV